MIGAMEETFGEFWWMGLILLAWALRIVLGTKKFTLKNLTKRLVYLPKFAFEGVWSERFMLGIVIVIVNIGHFWKQGFSLQFLLISLLAFPLTIFIFILFWSLFVTDIEEDKSLE